MSARGPILWRIQRLHRAVAAAREDAKQRPVVVFEDAESDQAPDTPEALVTPPPVRELREPVEVEPSPPRPIDPRTSTIEAKASTHERNLCPICSEHPVQTEYRGKGLCMRCKEELRGW